MTVERTLILEGVYSSEEVRAFAADPRTGSPGVWNAQDAAILDSNDYVFVKIWEDSQNQFIEVSAA
ncbi:MAG: hypothetical protein N2235_05080 [Fischerella sp.]|nr:hypothetical protein [Fischerella sp.]